MNGLSNEVIAKLNDHKPTSIGRIAYFRHHAGGDFNSADLPEKQGLLRKSA